MKNSACAAAYNARAGMPNRTCIFILGERNVLQKYREAFQRLSHSFFKPTLLAIVSFIILVVLLFSTFFFRSVYLSLEQDVYDMAKSQADLSARNVSILLTDISNLSAKIVNDKKLSKKAYDRGHRDAYLALMNYNLTFYNKYDNLMLYYPGEDYLLTLDGTCRVEVAFPKVTDCDTLMRDLAQSDDQAVFSTLDYGVELSDSQVIFAYSFKQSMLVLFVLDHANVFNLLGDGQPDRGDSLHLILDEAGKILYADTMPDEAMLTALLAEQEENDVAKRVHVQDDSYLYTQNALPYGVRLVTLNRVINQFEGLNRLVNMTLMCCVLVIIVGLAVLGISILRGYLPIAQLAQSAQSLIDPEAGQTPVSDIGTLRQVFMQYGKLSQETSRSAQLLSSAQLKGMFILRVMNGRYASQEENDHICEHLGLSFPYGRFCACVMLLDRAPAPEELSRLEPVLADLSGDGFTACFCQADDRCSALGVINFAQDNQLPAIGQQIMNRLREANPQFPAPTLAMGHGYEDMQHIPVSYIEARAALDYRLVFGTHTVILYDYLRVSEANEGAYPRHLLDAFTRGLLNWDVEAISRELSKLTQYIRDTPMSLQQVKCVCMEISTAFMREAHHISTAHPFNAESFDVFHICEYASIDELAGHITELSVAMQRYLQSTENLCQDNDIQRCLMIMDQNIANCQFSLEALSDQFSITPQTLRRRFKNATGKTMNDYMTSLRLDQAKRLLQDTQLELADICAQCGYNDLSSFIRLFKSKTGETPGRYREIHRTW